jgi:hypothetical protein
VTDIPNIRVVIRNGAWYSLDNRRLWVFKQFGRAITADIVVDDIRLDPWFTTTTSMLLVKILATLLTLA